MDEKFSSFLDGEVDSAELDMILERLKDDGQLRQNCDTYQLIGDALRGHLGDEVLTRVASRLATESFVIGRPRADRLGGINRMFWPAMSAAAGVAAVAIVAYSALSGSDDIAQIGAETQTVKVMPRVAEKGKLDRYLLAHQRFSASSTMQGVAPYVRTVSEERNGPAK